MRNIFHKLIIALILASGLAIVPAAQAKFNSNDPLLNYDAIVTAISPGSIMVDTNGTVAMRVHFDNKTKFKGGLLLEDIMPGDSLTISANNVGGLLFARSVKPNSHGGKVEPVSVKRVKVIHKSIDSFTVEVKPGIRTVFYVNNKTKFHGTTFSGLKLGDILNVNGSDTGSHFVAHQVWLVTPEGPPGGSVRATDR